MTTSNDIKIKLKNITKKWFYLKEEIPDIIDGQLNAVYSYIYNNYQSKNVGYSDRNKNIVTDNNGNITTEDKPTIPSASSTTPSADTTSGNVGTGTTWAKADHTHPKSTLYAEASHIHNNYLTNQDITGKADSSDFDTVTATVTYTDNTSETVTFYIVPSNNNG